MFHSCSPFPYSYAARPTIYGALPNNGCWAAKWGSLLELGLRFWSSSQLASVLLDASLRGIPTLRILAPRPARARSNQGPDLATYAPGSSARDSRGKLLNFRSAQEAPDRYLMDNLDPVEATEIFLEDAAAAANEPDHKNEIM